MRNSFISQGILTKFSHFFLSSSALAHIISVLWFKHFWRNYGPLLFFFKYSKIHFCVQLLHFLRDFGQTFTEALSSIALVHISVFCESNIFDRIMALCFFLNIAKYTSVHNFSYISQGILTRLSQKLCHHMSWCILSVFWNSNIFDGIMPFVFIIKNHTKLFLLKIAYNMHQVTWWHYAPHWNINLEILVFIALRHLFFHIRPKKCLRYMDFKVL